MMEAALAETARQRHLNSDRQQGPAAFIRVIADNERKLGGRRMREWDAVRPDALLPARHCRT